MNKKISESLLVYIMLFCVGFKILLASDYVAVTESP